MENCKYCKLTEEDATFVFQNDNWKAQLANEQSYLGRCVVASRRHVATLSDLTREEWADFGELMRGLEPALKESLGAALINWGFFMNHAYLTENPDPHMHAHVRPRYNRPVYFDEIEFTDPDFGHPYNDERDKRVSPETHRKIIERIKMHIPAAATQTF